MPLEGAFTRLYSTQAGRSLILCAFFPQMECCLLDWLITAYCGPCALSQELNQLARYERRPKPVPMVPVMMPAMPVMYPGAPQPMMMAPMGYSENVMIQPAVMYPQGAQPGMLMMMVGGSAYQC